MLAEVFIFIQHVIGFHISIGKTGLFSSSRYRAMAFFYVLVSWDDKFKTGHSLGWQETS